MDFEWVIERGAAILQALVEGQYWLAYGLLGSLFVSLAVWEESRSPNYAKRVSELDRSRSHGWYRTRLEQGLDGLSRLIGDVRPENAVRPSLTAQGYFFCVLLAIAYPILFAFIAWASGADGRLGALVLFDADAAIWRRWAAAALMVFAATSGLAALLIRDRITDRAVASAGAFAVAGAIAIVSATTICCFYLSRSVDRHRWGSSVGVLFALVFLLFAAVLLLWGETRGTFGTTDPDTSRISFQQICAMLLLIPLANAVMDWLSLGASRALLGVSSRQSGTGFGVFAIEVALAAVDVVIGLILLVGAAMASISVMAFMDAVAIHAGSGTPVIDTSGLLAGMAREPFAPQYVWVHLLVVTTLLWTALHFIAFVSSVWSRLFFGLPFLGGWLEKAWRDRAEQQARGEIPDTDNAPQRGLLRGVLHTFSWVTPIIFLVAFGRWIWPKLDEGVVFLVNHALFPVHDFVTALVVQELVPRLPQ